MKISVYLVFMILFFMSSVVVAQNVIVAQQTELGKIFSTEYPETFYFLRSLPKYSVVLTWIDGGKAVEEFTQLKTVTKYPSQRLVELGAFSNNYSGPIETEETLNDISTFFTTTDEDIALSIAAKYNVKYILVTDDIIFKQHWMQRLVKICDEKQVGCKYYSFVIPTDTYFEQFKAAPGELIEFQGGYYYIPPELKDTILTKMLFKSDNLSEFKEVYSDERSKVFEIPKNPIIAYIVVSVLAAGILSGLVLVLLVLVRRKK